MTSTAEERYELISRGLQEVLGADTIKAILAEGRTPKCYWGQSLDQRFATVKS
jgi:tyrosyl-tRNA synthetase